MTTLIFGHKSPDTDSTGAPLIWEWFVNHQGGDARAVLLGEPNTEAAFMLTRWGLSKPDITIRPLACTATIMHDLMGDHANHMPDAIKGAMLSCILSDTLEFRSPTTTDTDRQLAESLAADLGINIAEYAAEMFAAKSDVSAFSEAELLRMDSKEYEVDGVKFRVSVLETTSPKMVLDRKAELMAAMPKVAGEDKVNEVLLFVVDILNEEATMLIPNDLSKRVAEASFGATVTGDSVVLPGIMSRKKQIIPNLKV